MAPSYISLQVLPEKGSLGIHYFISKHDYYFEPLGYVMDGWAVLDLSSILFLSQKYIAGALRLVVLKFYFIKSQIIEYCVLRTYLYQTGAKFPVFCLKRLTTRLI